MPLACKRATGSDGAARLRCYPCEELANYTEQFGEAGFVHGGVFRFVRLGLTPLPLSPHPRSRRTHAFTGRVPQVRPRAGAIAAIKFKGPLSSEELGEELAAEGISIKPAYCFTDSVVTTDTDYFRVGFGESKMPVALDAFRAYVERKKDEWRAKL